MELFTIQCTTCRARLKVKDESAIGDILACPKCSSMVHVVPPLGWTRAAAAAGSSSDVLPIVPMQNTSAQAAVTQPVVPPALPTRGAASPVRAAASKVAATPVALVAAAPVEIAATVGTPPPIVAPPSSPASGTLLSRINGDWLLYGGGLTAGALLGACVWWFIAGQDSSPTVGVEPATTIALAPTPKTTDAPIAEVAKSPVAKTPQLEPAPSYAAPPAAATLPSHAAVARAADEKVQEPVSEAPAEPAATNAAPAPSKSPSPAIKLDPIEKPAAAAKSDQPADDGGGATPSAADDAAEPRATPKAAPAAAESNDSLQGPLSKAEVEQRLTVSLPPVEFVKVPLAQFVDFISDFTAIAIAIDDNALAKVGKKRHAPVTIKLTEATAREALDAAVGPLGLTCVVRGSRLVVTVDAEANASK